MHCPTKMDFFPRFSSLCYIKIDGKENPHFKQSAEFDHTGTAHPKYFWSVVYIRFSKIAFTLHYLGQICSERTENSENAWIEDTTYIYYIAAIRTCSKFLIYFFYAKKNVPEMKNNIELEGISSLIVKNLGFEFMLIERNF